MRVVIDTNIWISFLIGKLLSHLRELIIQDKVVLLFSDELFHEMQTVLKRPKFQKYFSQQDIQQLSIILCDKVEWVEITTQFEDCRDIKDNFLLNLGISGKADVLVAGDKDLLILNHFHGMEIIDYKTFERLLG